MLALACGVPQAGWGSQVWQAEKVIAVGDIHGAYSELVELLTGIGVLDEQLRWAAGDAHFVSVGDLLDRGAQSKRVMDLFMRMTHEAQAAGGRVHVLLGNHEAMNLTGTLRDVSNGEFAALGGLEGHTRAFAIEGKYGRWLLSLPVMVIVNDSLFVHGGVTTTLDGLELVNAGVRRDLIALKEVGDAMRAEGLLTTDQNYFDIDPEELPAHVEPERFLAARNSSLLGDWGPFWYRGNALCHPLLERGGFRQTLQRFGVQRIVVGHSPTPTREIESRFDGGLLLIDTGMLKSTYRGNPRALEINHGRVRALTPGGVGKIVDRHANRRLVLQGLRTGKLTRTEKGLTLTSDGKHITADAMRLSARERRRWLAAMALDEYLGTGFVVPLAEREVDDRKLLLMQRVRLTWQAERSGGRVNHCERGSDFDLVRVFDSLLGMTARSAQNLGYQKGTDQIYLAGWEEAFGAADRLPEYASDPVLPAAIRPALARLDLDTLQDLLGDLLKPREMRAMLKRRDRILQWPSEQ